MIKRLNSKVTWMTALLMAAGTAFAVSPVRADDGRHDTNAAGDGFIYLDDGSSASDLPPLFPDDTALSPESIRSGAKSKRKPFYVLDNPSSALFSPLLQPSAHDGLAGQRSSLQLGYGNFDFESGAPSGLGVWLSSEVKVQAPERFGLLGETEEFFGFDQRSYNVGLGVGYDGFSFGASIHQAEDDFVAGYSGFDLGLAYQGRSWFTNIQYAGYRNDQGPLFYSFLNERKLQAFEVGAGYALWTGRLTFSGRFKYFDYSNPLFPDSTPAQEHVFSLGTKLNF